MPPGFNSPEFLEPSGDAGHLNQIQPNVEAQLNSPADVQSAHQFFTPKGETASLPNINLNGSETAAIAPGAESAVVAPGADGGTTASVVSGAEHAMSSLTPGMEQAIMPGAENMMGALPPPGGEPVSPLIQLIMKMPGFTGIVSSLFEFFGSLLGGGNLLQLFDPIMWMQHAGSMVGNMIEQIPVAINMIPANGNFLQFLGPGMFQPGQMMMHMNGVAGLEHISPAVDPLDVSGPVNMQNPVFEGGGQWTTNSYPQDSMFNQFMNKDQLAVNNDAPVYRPTMGGFYNEGGAMQNAAQSGGAATTGTTTQAATTHTAPSHQVHHGAHHGSSHHGVRAREIALKEQPVDQANDAPQVQSEATQTPGSDAPATDAAPSDYTVQKGDCLWDIARKQLGDGSRWGEIYRLNADVIGQNPDLIHAGVNLKMPGTDIAQGLSEGGKYVVQPGDNLWDISRHHMGGGQNWGELYRANEGVIGSNPNLIHPGQELQVPGAQQIAGLPDSGGLDAPAAVPQAQPIQSQPMPAAQAPVSAPTNSFQNIGADTNYTAPPATSVDATSASLGPDASSTPEMFNAPNGGMFLRKPGN